MRVRAINKESLINLFINALVMFEFSFLILINELIIIKLIYGLILILFTYLINHVNDEVNNNLFKKYLLLILSPLIITLMIKVFDYITSSLVLMTGYFYVKNKNDDYHLFLTSFLLFLTLINGELQLLVINHDYKRVFFDTHPSFEKSKISLDFSKVIDYQKSVESFKGLLSNINESCVNESSTNKFNNISLHDLCIIQQLINLTDNIPYVPDIDGEVYVYPEIMEGADCEDRAMLIKSVLDELSYNNSIGVTYNHAFNIIYLSNESYVIDGTSGSFIKLDKYINILSIEIGSNYYEILNNYS